MIARYLSLYLLVLSLFIFYPVQSFASPPSDLDARIMECARTDLAKELNIAIEKVYVKRIIPKVFRDGCFGIPAASERCRFALTPGYRMLLCIKGDKKPRTYEYRANNQSLRRLVAVNEGRRIDCAQE